MIQQFHYWVNIQRRRKQYLEKIHSLPCLLLHYSQSLRHAHQQINGEKKMWYIYKIEYYSATKRGYPAICDNMNEPEHIMLKVKSGRERQILYDIIHR